MLTIKAALSTTLTRVISVTFVLACDGGVFLSHIDFAPVYTWPRDIGEMELDILGSILSRYFVVCRIRAGREQHAWGCGDILGTWWTEIQRLQNQSVDDINTRTFNIENACELAIWSFRSDPKKHAGWQATIQHQLSFTICMAADFRLRNGCCATTMYPEPHAPDIYSMSRTHLACCRSMECIETRSPTEGGRRGRRSGWPTAASPGL